MRWGVGCWKRLDSWPFAIVVFTIGSSWLVLWRLGATDIVSMEGIVGEVSRAMVATGDFAIPRQHGEIYTFKPPLLYWLSATSIASLGDSEWALRLPAGLSFVGLGLVVLLVVGSRVSPRVGWVCAVASTTTALAFEKLRVAEFDTALAASVGTAMVFAVAELTAEVPRAWRWQAVYVALAAACLFKGIPALMYFGPGLLVAAWFTSSLGRLLTGAHVAGVLVLGITVGGWVGVAWLAEGMAAFEQPLFEAHEKGLSWSSGALAASLLKPLVFLVAFLPWSLPLLTTPSSSAWTSLGGAARSLVRGALGFVVAGVLAYMAVPSTEARYLLPLAAPVGILSGVLMTGSPRPRLHRVSIGLGVGVAVVLMAGAPWLASSGELEVPLGHVYGLCILGLSLALAIWWVGRRGPGQGATVMVHTAISVALWFVTVYAIAPHRAHSRSLREVAAAFDSHLGRATVVWSAPVSSAFHHSSLDYYLRRPIRTYSEGGNPPVGSYVVTYSDEDPGPLPFHACLLETRVQRGYEFRLLRVEAGVPQPGEPRSCAERYR